MSGRPQISHTTDSIARAIGSMQGRIHARARWESGHASALSILPPPHTAIPGTPGFGILDAHLSADDIFYLLLTLFAAGC